MANGLRVAGLVDIRADIELLADSLARHETIGLALAVAPEARVAGELQASLIERGVTGLRVASLADAALGLEDRAGALIDLAGAEAIDWLLPLCADDIWLPSVGSLQGLPDPGPADVMSVMRYAVVIGPGGPELPPVIAPDTYPSVLLYARPYPDIERQLRRHPTTPRVLRLLAPRLMVRPGAGALLWDGPAERGTTEWHQAIATELLVASVSRGTQRLASEEVAAGRISGEIRSAAEIFERLIPELGTEDAYSVAVRRAQPWLSAVGRVLRQEDLPFHGRLEHRAGLRPSVVVPPDHVVKLYSPWQGGTEVMAREVRALRVAARDATLPVPRLVAQGNLDDPWRYVVLSRRPGNPFSQLRSPVLPADAAAIAAWLGAFVRRLQAVPISDAERAEGWRTFVPAIRGRHAAATRLMAERGALPPRLVAQVRDWMPPLDGLIGTPGDLVLTHADLTSEHIVGEVRDGRFEPVGVIDLGEATLAHPLYDLGPAWWSILQLYPQATGPFLREAGFRATWAADFPKVALAWCLMHPCFDIDPPSGIDEASDLDDLAWRLFGAYVRDPAGDS